MPVSFWSRVVVDFLLLQGDLRLMAVLENACWLRCSCVTGVTVGVRLGLCWI